MRKPIIPVLCGAVFLAGCQTTDDAIQRNLTLACTAVEVAHGVFTDIAASVHLNDATLKLEADAHDDAARLCANPGTNTQDVTVAVLRLSVKIGLAVAEAKRAKDAGDGG